MLVLNGAGTVAGLATYGYKLFVALGFHLTKLSPSRGFCIPEPRVCDEASRLV
jgi:phosphate/sulfate permease